MLWPAAVDVSSTGANVGARQRQARRFQQRDEPALESAKGDPGLPVEDVVELSGAWRMGSSGQGGIDHGSGQAMADLCLVAEARQCVEGEDCGEVDDRARDCRDRDGAVDRCVLLGEATATGDYAGDASVANRAHLGPWRGAFDQTEDERGRQPAERGALTASQHGGHVASLRAARPVAHPIHTAMLAVKETLGEPASDRGGAQSTLEDLLTRNNPVLSRCNRSDLAVR
jgi:hypothetical protein